VIRVGLFGASIREIALSVGRSLFISIGSLLLFIATYFLIGKPLNFVNSPEQSINNSKYAFICGSNPGPSVASNLQALGILIPQMVIHCLIWVALGALALIATSGALVGLAVPYFLVCAAGLVLRVPESFSGSFFIDRCAYNLFGENTLVNSLVAYMTFEVSGILLLLGLIAHRTKKQKLKIR